MYKDDCNIYDVRAQFDLKIVQTYIFTMDISEIETQRKKRNFAELFSQQVIQWFYQYFQLANLDAPVASGEEPSDFVIPRGFNLVDDYF